MKFSSVLTVRLLWVFHRTILDLGILLGQLAQTVVFDDSWSQRCYQRCNTHRITIKSRKNKWLLAYYTKLHTDFSSFAAFRFNHLSDLESHNYTELVPRVSHVKKYYWLAIWSRLEKKAKWLTDDLSQYDWRRRRSASEMHTRRMGLATRNQSALFMMGINWYVKCVLYSVNSTVSQQLASLQLLDIEDT